MGFVIALFPFPEFCVNGIIQHAVVFVSGLIHLVFHCCCCSVAQLYLILCNPMDCSTPGFPVLHHLPEHAQTYAHWISDAIQPSHPLLSPSPPAFNLFQHQHLFQWVNSSHQVAKIFHFMTIKQFVYDSSFSILCTADLSWLYSLVDGYLGCLKILGHWKM